MNLEDLIPKFEVGERVIVHIRPTEGNKHSCPSCGHSTKIGDFKGVLKFESTILGVAVPRWRCLECGYQYVDNCEGYWQVKIPDDFPLYPGQVAGIPWPLLERVEGSR